MEHPRPFAYRAGDFIRPPLQPFAYRARELLNCTVASFYRRPLDELTPRQRNARHDFIRLFTCQMQVPFESFDSLLKELHDTLSEMTQHLDEFFFFGSLTNGPTPFIRAIKLIADEGGTDWLGLCHVGENEKGVPRIDISIRRYHDQHQNLAELVNTLAHEMIHAFLFSFACRCSKCQRNRINTIGMKGGHGPTFRGLHYAVMKTMADWSLDLNTAFEIRTGGKFIDITSLELERAEIEAARRRGALRDMLPYISNPSQLLLIRTAEEEIRVDLERLRANVQATAARIDAIISNPTGVSAGWDDTDDEDEKPSPSLLDEDFGLAQYAQKNLRLN